VSIRTPWPHDPEKACPGLDPGCVCRFSDTIMRNQTAAP
jgi:hypothetical protein